MNPTWVMSFPTGYETGTYLAIDMGGTNLRICEIDLAQEKGEFDIMQSKYRMPEELKSGTAEELWGYIADCLQQFVEYHHEGERIDQLPLGFTFSYPVTQNYIDHGVLQRWTKGFDIEGVEGNDVVPPFEEAVKERVCVDQLDFMLRLTYSLGPTCQTNRSHQRHCRYPHRLSLHRRGSQNRLHLWHRLQRRIHGQMRQHSQTRRYETEP
jgi:hypothetical protein